MWINMQPRLQIRKASTRQGIESQHAGMASQHQHQHLLDWLEAQVQAINYIGGVPVSIVCDNLKAGVAKGAVMPTDSLLSGCASLMPCIENIDFAAHRRPDRRNVLALAQSE